MENELTKDLLQRTIHRQSSWADIASLGQKIIKIFWKDKHFVGLLYKCKSVQQCITGGFKNKTDSVLK